MISHLSVEHHERFCALIQENMWLLPEGLLGAVFAMYMVRVFLRKNGERCRNQQFRREPQTHIYDPGEEP